jgi:hypothetical protein
MNSENFDLVRDFISSTGPYIKQLTIVGDCDLEVDQGVLQNLLNLLPNLESLTLKDIREVKGESRWDLKLQKIERVKIKECSARFGSLLDSLGQCVVKEASLVGMYFSPFPSEFVLRFLKAQENNLEKLTLSNVDLEMLNDLKKLRENLKILKLGTNDFSDKALDMICELTKLETLQLYYIDDNGFNWNKLLKLKNLKTLRAGYEISENILEHLNSELGIFNDLEHLEGPFADVTEEQMKELKKIAPNLKSIEIQYLREDSSFSMMMENLASFEKLESVTYHGTWELSEEQKFICPKIKSFDGAVVGRHSAEQVTKMLPNVEYLTIQSSDFNINQLIAFFLIQLKHLKKLSFEYMRRDAHFDPEYILRCFEDYGKNLMEIHLEYSKHRIENEVSLYTMLLIN